MSTSTQQQSQQNASSFDKTKDDTSAINVPVRTTSLSGAMFNLTKSAVGAGTVFLPAIYYVLGPVTATVLLFLGAVLCAISLHFLGRMAHHCETGDYFKLGRLALGRHGETAVSVSLLLFLIGGLIAYAYLTGLYFATALATLRGMSSKDVTFFNPGNLTLLAAGLAIFPLSCMRDMSALAKTSILGMVSMLFIAGLLAYDAFTFGNDNFGITSSVTPVMIAPVMTTYEYSLQLCGFIGKLIFAFVNHFTIVSLVPVMKNPSAKSRLSLITVSTVSATVIYLLAAFGGYYRFGSGLRPFNKEKGTYSLLDALSVFQASSVPLPYTIAQLALVFVLICTFPLLCDPARSCLDSLVFGASSVVPAATRHYIETALIVAVPSTVAYFFQDGADDFLSLFAGFCGSLLVFSFPGAFFLILSRRFKYSVSSVERSLAYFCVVLGGVLAVLSTFVNVKNLIGA